MNIILYSAHKGPSSQGYGFSSGHVWMWELDCEESWGPKNWCFWTVVLEKTLESPLDWKEIQPVHPKDQSWVFIGRTDVGAETLILWPPHAKSWLTAKDPDAGKDWEQEKGTMEGEMVGWHHGLDGRESEWTPGVSDGQEGLACCNFMGLQRVGYDWATALNWTELILTIISKIFKNSLDGQNSRIEMTKELQAILRQVTRNYSVWTIKRKKVKNMNRDSGAYGKYQWI